MCISLTNQLCNHLNIRCFIIPHPPVDPKSVSNSKTSISSAGSPNYDNSPKSSLLSAKGEDRPVDLGGNKTELGDSSSGSSKKH